MNAPQAVLSQPFQFDQLQQMVVANGAIGRLLLAALLGGLVIATIYNGMGLLGLAASYQYMVTALVLLAAVTIDALARRGRTSS